MGITLRKIDPVVVEDVVAKPKKKTAFTDPAANIVSHWKMTARDWVAVVGTALGAFMAVLDIQITNASLREIQGSLGLDFSEGGWISTAYLIAEVAVIPLTGYLSKVFGMRNYLLVNGVVFVIASLLCGMAWNLESMIGFRILQGLAGGILIPMSFQSILLYMPPERRSVGLAIFGLTATLAPTLGPSLGGFLTENYGWRWNFFINLMPGIATLMMVSYGMPKAKPQWNLLKSMDYLGATLLVISLASATYVLEDGARHEWFQDEVIRGCFLAALIAFPLFLWTQFIGRNPLMNLRLLGNRNFGLSAAITTLAATALYGGIYALSLYLGQIQNYNALYIGRVMMWVGIPQLFVMPLLPFLMKRFDLRLLALLGLGMFAASNFLNSALDMNYSGENFQFSLIIRAIGQPFFLIPLSAMGMAMINPAESGNASSIFNVLRNLGGSIGIALTGTQLLNRQAIHMNQQLDKIQASSMATQERLFGIKNYFMSKGFDGVTAKTQATKLMAGIALRESTIQAFGDLFLLMTVILIVCASLVFFLKRVDPPSGPGEIH